MRDVDVVGVIKLLVGALAPAAIFYAFGYVITRAYVVSTGLQASFWFTEGFYREAGARFLLDIVVALALLPHLFIPLSALFLVLLPGRGPAQWRRRFAEIQQRLGLARTAFLRNTAFGVLVLLAVIAIVLVLISCGSHACGPMREAPRWLFTSNWLLVGAEQKWTEQQPALFPMVIFLALSIPTALTLGLWAYRMLTGDTFDRAQPDHVIGEKDASTRRTPHPFAAFFVASGFAVLSFYIPIAYGAYFYDFVVVRLVNADKCGVPPDPQSAQNAGKSEAAGAYFRVSECYLLGRFDNSRYILIGREDEGSERKIYIKQVSDLEPFAIESWVSTPLRSLKRYTPTSDITDDSATGR